MKKIIVLVLCSMFLISVKAVNYCASSAWGYASNVTGGGNATPISVNSVSQLTNALTGKNVKNKVVIITQNLTFTSMLTIQDAQNITIMALPGVKLISNQQTKDESGIFFIKRTSNLILRNLIFEGPGAYDVDGNDNLCFEDVTNAWVDHCDFQDGMDGNFDIKGETDDITVSWCRFRYLKEPKAGGSGGADDHRFTNLVGSSSSDKPADGTYNITYGFCWWDEGCVERMTRCRNALIHYLNCYWNSSVSNYYVCPEKASGYFEGCTFAGKANTNSKNWKEYKGSEGQNYCKFVNCTGKALSDAGSVAAPSYAYDQLTAATAKSHVTNSTCGAGATLTVTNAGVVSSSCDSEEPVDPPTPSGNLTWNFSTSDFTSKDSLAIDAGITINGLTIGKNMILDKSSKTISGVTFTHRLKTGGTGSSSKRYLQFDVTGACTIEVYLVSAGSAGRTLNIYSGSYGSSLLTTMTAPQSTPVKQSFNYTGEATTIYMGSANSGINLYAINVIYPGDDTTALEHVVETDKTHKIIREGRLLILHDNKTYDLVGRRVD